MGKDHAACLRAAWSCLPYSVEAEGLSGANEMRCPSQQATDGSLEFRNWLWYLRLKFSVFHDGRVEPNQTPKDYFQNSWKGLLVILLLYNNGFWLFLGLSSPEGGGGKWGSSVVNCRSSADLTWKRRRLVMKRSRVVIGCSVVSVLLVLAVVVIVAFHSREEPYKGKPYVPQPIVDYGDSSKLSRTVFVPTIDTAMPSGKNVVWCGSFQLAWNHLGQDVLHAPPIVANAGKIVSQLNGSKFSESDMPKDGCFATAGLCRDSIVDRIRQEMQRRFQRTPKIELTDPSYVIVAYGYLEASIPFKIPYFENPKPLLFKESDTAQTSVTSFGTNFSRESLARHGLSKQIKVLYWPGGLPTPGQARGGITGSS